jgi:hypothetical protein
MDNTETQTTVGTRHRTKTRKAKNARQEIKKMNKSNPSMNTGATSGVCKGKAVPAFKYSVLTTCCFVKLNIQINYDSWMTSYWE